MLLGAICRQALQVNRDHTIFGLFASRTCGRRAKVTPFEVATGSLIIPESSTQRLAQFEMGKRKSATSNKPTEAFSNGTPNPTQQSQVHKLDFPPITSKYYLKCEVFEPDQIILIPVRYHSLRYASRRCIGLPSPCNLNVKRPGAQITSISVSEYTANSYLL